MTEVVPSPTYSSWTLASSITLLAAGCCTSISRRIALLNQLICYPSLVITIPPIGSSSILSIAWGPRVEVTIYATAWKYLKIFKMRTRPLMGSLFEKVYFSSLNVRELCFTPSLTFCVAGHYHYGCLHLSLSLSFWLDLIIHYQSYFKFI